MDAGLNSARTAGTIPTFDEQNGTLVYFFVDIAWTGLGDITTLRLKDHVVTPSFTVDYAGARGIFRDATASGTITDGVTNFTPSASTSAGLGLVQFESVSVTIQRQ